MFGGLATGSVSRRFLLTLSPLSPPQRQTSQGIYQHLLFHD